MKRLKGYLLILLLNLICFTSLSAQTDAERKFLASTDSLNTLLSDAYTGKDYPAAEILCQKIIDLYDAHATQLAEGYAYFKYSSYYNMASVQAIQGKKQEAANNLLKALDSGMIEVSYNKITNDEDLKDILDAPELQPALKRLKETTNYLYILQNSPEYTRTQSVDSLPQIVYAQADEPDLKRVRDYFRLDSVAVAGDELATIKRILTYIHDKIRHDGQNGNPKGGNNSINFAEACKDGSRGLNCRGLATVLVSNLCFLIFIAFFFIWYLLADNQLFEYLYKIQNNKKRKSKTKILRNKSGTFLFIVPYFLYLCYGFKSNNYGKY